MSELKLALDSDAPFMLSISGMRGVVGKTMTPEVATRYGAAIGSWLVTMHQEGGGQKGIQGEMTRPRCAVGRDSRPSGAAIELALAAGLASVGVDVIQLGIASTPGVAIMVQHLGCAGGCVITASHNPIAWNGIKVIRHDGTAPPPDQAGIIVERFQTGDLAWAGPTEYGAVTRDESNVAVHIAKVLPLVDVEAIRRRGLKVVVDSVHGAGGPEAAALLDALGVERVHLYEAPTGLFPHTPEPTQENLSELSAAVAEHGADVGFAQDPDADRLAMVDEGGAYIGEEYTLALCAKHLLRAGDHAVANLSSSRMLDDIAAAVGATVHRSAVGEANVAAVMREWKAVVGGEGNGGIIDPRVSYVRDSLVGMALTLEMLATTGKPLSAQVAEIPRYTIIKQKLDASPELIAAIAPNMLAAFGQQDGETVSTVDGVRADVNKSWVHVRPSNTEPIVRVIAEAETADEANRLIERARKALGV